MECLIGYIGLKICGDETSESGLFINSLPGISLESIDKTANEEQVTYAQVWEDAQQEAAIRFYIDFLDVLGECHKLTPYCDYEQVICDNKRVLANAWRYLLGNQLMMFRLYTNRLNRYTTVDLDEAKKLLDFYQVSYENALRQAAKLVDTSACFCLDCTPNPNHVVWRP